MTHAPGITRDSGSISIPGLIPITYSSLGLPGSVELASPGGREDVLTLEGTGGTDVSSLAAGSGIFMLNSQSPLDPSGAAHITVNGGIGDDLLGAVATPPFTTTTLSGGDSVSGDRASLTGAGAGVALDSAASTITGYGGVVQLVSIEGVSTSQTGDPATDLTVLGAATADDIIYRPTGPQTGVVTVNGFQAPLNFAGAGGSLVIDPLGDSDKVSVLGTLADDQITALILPITSIQVNATKTVMIPQATAEKIAVFCDEGADLFDVTTFDSVAARLFVFGDQPSSKRFSEKMNVRNGSPSHVQYRDVKAHVFENGSIFAEYRSTSNTTRIDYESVENLKFFR